MQKLFNINLVTFIYYLYVSNVVKAIKICITHRETETVRDRDKETQSKNERASEQEKTRAEKIQTV